MRSGGSFRRYLGMNKEKKEVVKVNQITEGVIWQQILIFFLPILFGTFFQQLYNTADAMIVGHFLGKQALAAVGGTTGTLINLLVGFFVGLSSGATVVISQHYGANKEDKVQWAVHTSIAFSILGGIVLTVVGIGCSRWMLDLMNTPDDVVNHALIYMRVYFLGTIGNLIYNMGSGILRAVGDSKRPLLYLIICCMTNIALDFLFVVGLQMGVMGAALATILSQIISAVLVMGSLMRTRDIYRLHLRKISIDWIMLKRIIRIGFPAGVQSIVLGIERDYSVCCQLAGNQQCGCVGGLRKGGRSFLDDDQCARYCGDNICRSELRCEKDGSCTPRCAHQHDHGIPDDGSDGCVYVVYR